MICPNCGKEVDNSRAFCPHCDYKMPCAPSGNVSYKSSSNNGFSKLSSSQIVWFKILKYIPTIFSCIFLVAICLISFIMCIEDNFEGGFRVFVFGCIGVAVTFCVMKISISPIIIQTECLMKLANYDN